MPLWARSLDGFEDSQQGLGLGWVFFHRDLRSVCVFVSVYMLATKRTCVVAVVSVDLGCGSRCGSTLFGVEIVSG
jgi:hypothetical protein